jgi:hypothetical protein
MIRHEAILQEAVAEFGAGNSQVQRLQPRPDDLEGIPFAEIVENLRNRPDVPGVDVFPLCPSQMFGSELLKIHFEFDTHPTSPIVVDNGYPPDVAITNRNVLDAPCGKLPLAYAT